jgi:hypothetical protein
MCLAGGAKFVGVQRLEPTFVLFLDDQGWCCALQIERFSISAVRIKLQENRLRWQVAEVRNA